MLSFLRTAHSKHRHSKHRHSKDKHSKHRHSKDNHVELEESELEDEDDELLPLLSEPFSPLLAGADAPPLTDAGLSLNNSKCHR